MITVNDKPANRLVFILYCEFYSLICDKKVKKRKGHKNFKIQKNFARTSISILKNIDWFGDSCTD